MTRTEAGQAKLEKLVSKRGDLTRNKNELEESMKGLFSSVFVHRYKDVRPEIRAVCITELGTWLTHYRCALFAVWVYRKFGNFCCKNIFIVDGSYKN